MILKKSIVTKSPHFETIIKKYNEVGTIMSNNKFHREYVSTIDPSISSRAWQTFMFRFNKKKQEKSNKILDKLADKQIKMSHMEDSSLRKILAITDITLDEIVGNPDLLKKIPIEQRMGWLFNTMKARDSRMTTITKIQSEKRKTSMYEDMLEGAQYGAIKEDEVLEYEIDKPLLKKVKGNNNKKIASEDQGELNNEKVVAFSPDEF